MNYDIGAELILSVRKLLSCLNTNEYSKTYGCFDRDFWHYKTLRDFPSSTYQQGVLALVLVYNNNFEGNIFFRNKEILKLIKDSISYWASIQNKDGSFNEWFPNEHSHVATAFTLYAVSESLSLIKDEIKIDDRIISCLKKGANWLCENKDEIVTNHSAGALMAIYNIYLLTGESKYLSGVNEYVEIVSNNQSKEGWFKEYDGCDLGYLSVSVDFLARYYIKSGDIRIVPMLNKAVNFMRYFIHPDGTYGGEHGSRNTKYMFTGGLLAVGHEIPFANSIALKFWLNGGYSTGMASDDRYLFFFFLPNYMETYLQISKLRNVLDWTEESLYDEKNFQEAGIYVNSNTRYYLVLNYKKGGIIKIFSVKDKKNIYNDTGYGAMVNGDILLTQMLDSKATADIKKDNNITKINIRHNFFFYKEKYPMKKLLIPFRIFNYTLGRSTFVMRFFNEKLKKFMILRNQRCRRLALIRIIENGENYVKIKDYIENKTKYNITALHKTKNLAIRHVPSSNLFRSSDFICSTDNLKEIKITF